MAVEPKVVLPRPESLSLLTADRQAAGGERSSSAVPDRLLRGRASAAYAETFRVLALQVLGSAQDRDLRSLLVMGAYPGDGRTTTVANLAIALAASGKRVVAVDADSACPTLASLFGLAPRDAEHGPVDADVRGVPVLTLAPGSNGDGTRTNELLGRLREQADFVLVDSPPCSRASDGFGLAPLVDAVLYVVRRRQQDVQLQRSVQSQLSRLGANVLGVIYNER